ncbi:hypothetical protein MG293_001665 [Ovis ammon polii]|uniref:Uncharacterized protein n=1 Tax=Ovis ammon polii TaxID=230172 RepID=A0AAD4URY1_OVIAM|nr:hypothetical protein MG293_001665 [Ovis ammon polii]
MLSYTVSIILSSDMNAFALKEIAKLCPTLCNPIDCSPPGSFVHGISQVRVAQEFGERSRRGLSPFPPLPLSSLGGPLAHPVRQTVTVQHPQKSQQRSLLAVRYSPKDLLKKWGQLMSKETTVHVTQV